MEVLLSEREVLAGNVDFFLGSGLGERIPEPRSELLGCILDNPDACVKPSSNVMSLNRSLY